MKLTDAELRQVIEDVNRLEALLELEKKVLSGPPTNKFHDIAEQNRTC